MSKTTKDPSSLAGWLTAAGLGLAVIAGMIALVFLYWVILGGVAALIAWAAFALSAPALGVTWLNLVIPGMALVALAALFVGGRK